jgi:uncharacterized protein with GYD domain
MQYTPEAIAAIMETGSNREEAARKAVESVGGKLHGFYGIFGDQDGYHVMLIAEMPGNAEYIATVVSAVMGGAIAKFTTNVLYSASDVVGASAIVQASKVDYQPPGA